MAWWTRAAKRLREVLGGGGVTESEQRQILSAALLSAGASREANTALQNTPLPTGTVSAQRETVDRLEDLSGAWGLMAGRATALQQGNISLDDLTRLPPHRTLEWLIDLSPEISNGLWYFLLMCNPGYTIKIQNLRNDGPHAEGQKIADKFIARLKDLYGSEDVVFASMFLSVFMRGGVLSEVVLDRTGTEFIDLATPDPLTLEAERINDSVRGTIWRYGQRIKGQFMPFTRSTIKYVALHRLPGAPFGRPIATSAIFVALFIMHTLRDLRRVIQQQGYPRLDITVDLEALRLSMPNDAQTSPDEFKKWADKAFKEITESYAKLRPEDTYIHSSVVTVNQPVGTLNDSSLGAVDALFRVLERQATRAVKSIPLLNGLDTRSSVSDTNRQWEAYVKGIQTVQQLVESVIEAALASVIQAGGVQCRVSVDFHALRATEELRDTQVAQLKAMVAAFCYNQGWISQDEAARLGVNKATADQSEPRMTANQTSGPDGGTVGGTNPDPSQMRITEILAEQ